MKCFACNRKLGKNPALVDTRDGQTVYVGSECFKIIKAAGDEGYQPPTGGPRLWVIPAGLSQTEIGELHKTSVRKL